MQAVKRFKSGLVRQVDLGAEPALTLSGEESTVLDRRQISVRWLAGTFLTGIAGTALMGGALMAAVDGETRFASDPGRANKMQMMAPSSEVAPHLRKTDRLPPRAVLAPTRQIFQIATATRMGEQEIIKTKPFARVRAGLALTRTALSSQIPAFNPAKIFAEAGTPIRSSQAPIITSTDRDAEMTLVMRGLDEAAPLTQADELNKNQILMVVRQTIAVENAASLSSSRPVMEQPAGAVPGLFSFGMMGNAGSADTQARIVPENITAISKSSKGGEAVNASDEKTIVVKPRDTLATILVHQGASLEEARLIIDVLARNFKASDLNEVHRLKISFAPSDQDPKKKILVRVSVMLDKTILATAILTDLGQYTAIDASSSDVEETAPLALTLSDEDETDADKNGSVSLYLSLYETALGQGIPRQLVDELVRIYAADFDFQRRVRPGDSFEVFYSAAEEAGQKNQRDDILFTSLTINGETRRYYRFRTDDDNIIDYYDEKGRSSKKFLMRKPMNTGKFTSGFGMRKHPLLGYYRLHTGVDWSAPTGSPIMAAGSGTVVKAGWHSGYGRRVEIQHANGYVTTYNHMSGFGRGVSPGVRVHQGQVVGYLGSSGLSTGPHLHYEVLVNGSFVDPMRIKVPRGRVLEGRPLADYEREIDHIDQMMRRPHDTAKVAASNP